ncbi:G protein-coupled glucose receptor regulating Gpa2-domain-containing protein [Aspergillus californicus]
MAAGPDRGQFWFIQDLGSDKETPKEQSYFIYLVQELEDRVSRYRTGHTPQANRRSIHDSATSVRHESKTADTGRVFPTVLKSHPSRSLLIEAFPVLLLVSFVSNSGSLIDVLHLTATRSRLNAMYSLIRAWYLVQSNPDRNLVSRQTNDHYERINGPTKAGFAAMGVIAVFSLLASLSLFAFLTHRFIFWKRYYKHPLVHNQYVVLIYNLLIADIQQATAFMLCLHWVAQDAVYYPSAACVLQGWWIQIADPGSGLFVIAIAMHTGAVVLRGRQLPYRAFVACVIGLWTFIIVLGIIPVALYGSRTFVISEAGWCWLSTAHENERLWGHYIWIFFAEFGTVVLYGVMFFYLRRRMSQAASLRQGHQESLKRLNRVVIYMVLYPFCYLVLSLPLAAGRMSSARHVVPSRVYFAVAGSLMAVSGLVDAVVYTLTRRQLLVDTELSASDGPYAYPGSQAYQTNISTTGETKRGRVGTRLRKGLQTLNETMNDDRDDSQESIVRKDEWEMRNLGHGQVYQETTIEITHEDAEPQPQDSEQRRHS